MSFPVLTSYDTRAWTSDDTLNADSQGLRPGCEFRDPFFMQYPAGSGQYVMYFTGRMNSQETMAVGTAFASTAELQAGSKWHPTSFPLQHTEQGVGDSRMESPHMFFARGRWWMGYTGAAQVALSVNSKSPSVPYDAIQSDWTYWQNPLWGYSVRRWLETMIGNDITVRPWAGSEYLNYASNRIQHEFLAAYDGDSIRIREMQWSDDNTFGLNLSPSITGTIGAVEFTAVGLHMVGYRPGASQVIFRIDMPTAGHVRLNVYDVAGRRVATLMNRDVPVGSTLVPWNGDGDGGIANGMYFARLESAGGRRMMRIPIVR